MATLYGAAPWCPWCEQGLALFDPDVNRVTGWRWLDRQLYRVAYHTSLDEVGRLSGAKVPARAPGGVRVGVTVAAFALHLSVVACLLVGIWLCVRDFPNLTILFGLVLILIAAELRPRFGRIGQNDVEVTRQDAPELYALAERVAAAVDAPPPQLICVNEDFNASSGAVGFRRRRVLTLGLPLWGALGPQERLALLGHELGHFVNGDVRRTLLTQPMYTMLPAVRTMLLPSRGAATGPMAWVGERMWRMLASVLRVGVVGAHVVLLWLAQRDSQRAEYLADALAEKVGGSAAVLDLLDKIHLADPVLVVLRRSARRKESASEWPGAAAQAVTETVDTMPLRHQLGVRTDVSLIASHPPTALRSRLIRSRPRTAATIRLDAHSADLIDKELATHYRNCVRSLALQ
jgi:Zn-dependent protease with chaperone function